MPLRAMPAATTGQQDWNGPRPQPKRNPPASLPPIRCRKYSLCGASRSQPAKRQQQPARHRVPLPAIRKRARCAARRASHARRRNRRNASSRFRGHPPNRAARSRSKAICRRSQLSNPKRRRSMPPGKHARPTGGRHVPKCARSRPASPSKKSAASGATHDVHIHIGRVELAAISAPAPAKRAASSDKRPMSLNEYLQHRRSPNTGSS